MSFTSNCILHSVLKIKLISLRCFKACDVFIIPVMVMKAFNSEIKYPYTQMK